MNGFASAVNHTTTGQLAGDQIEQDEWRDALASLVANAGPARARQILDVLAREGGAPHIDWKPRHGTPYINSISVEQQPAFPGDLATEERLASLVRWNALAMVVRANQAYGELGGHIASYASAADLFEVGFNHFFRARHEGFGGDLVFYQPHSAPGIYARAFLEGRLSEQDLAHYRQEIGGAKVGARGLSSYPHPWLMPDFWQFPTGSMGIGPISSIFQARFMRYLQHRGLQDTTERHVWGVFGDGEMDEPESMSALTLAAREGLDNLTWVVNCNLQRLDGPVRGNGRIIDELEALFGGAGWNVIKLVWGSDWDALLAKDSDGALVNTLSQTVDGQFQTFAAKDGAYNREHFFGQSASLARLVEGMSDEQIDRLKRGGHDMVKIHAAYHAARRVKGKPTVILAQTKKGFGMGEAGQGKMTTHQQKKLDREALIAFRNRFQLPLTDEQTESLSFFKPAADSLELRYLHQRRNALGGYVPSRCQAAVPVSVPPLAGYAGFATAAAGKEMSTTMAFVRMLTNLLKDKHLRPRIVPIVADEARTFGMANLFKQIGIYSSVGQRYEPEDIGSILSYREATDGQILEEGISEASAISSWVAAATSYSVHGLRMLPFYIYYSMFGFQRVGDLIWAAADQRAQVETDRVADQAHRCGAQRWQRQANLPAREQLVAAIQQVAQRHQAQAGGDAGRTIATQGLTHLGPVGGAGIAHQQHQNHRQHHQHQAATKPRTPLRRRSLHPSVPAVSWRWSVLPASPSAAVAGSDAVSATTRWVCAGNSPAQAGNAAARGRAARPATWPAAASACRASACPGSPAGIDRATAAPGRRAADG